MPIIMHVDMNSYFASVAQQLDPMLRGKPIGITGKRTERSVVAAASKEAKLLGVKTAMSTWEAKRICPSIILVPGNPEAYAEITHRFNKIFDRYASAVQKFSVDESFLDVTDTARDYLGAIMFAQMIKRDLRKECGEYITASVGIGPNKLIAKAASDMMKPDGLVVVRPEQVIPFLNSLKLKDLCGIGPRIGRRLETMGITTIQQLRETPPVILEDEFKSYGLWLAEAAWGRDASAVNGKEEAPKSYGHSYTLPRDTHSVKMIQHYLLGLCDRVAYRMRRDGCAAQQLSVYVRYGNFSGTGTQRRMKEPIADGLIVYKTAWAMLEGLLDISNKEIHGLPVRLIGVSASSLTEPGSTPSMFTKDRKMTAVLRALDKARTRHGHGAWTRASLIPLDLKERTSGFAYDHEL